MEDNKISEIMDVTLTKIRQLVDTNTIVGSPITTPDGIIVIPVSRVSFGFGSGGGSGTGNASGKGAGYMGGNGGAVKVEPIGFMVIKDGACRMINIAPPPHTTLDRVIEMLPDVLDKFESISDKRKADKV